MATERLGEFELIDAITAGLPTSPAIVLGPGDDSAVFRVDGDAAISTDAIVEGVHFRRDWSGPHDVGRKVVAAAVADLEAMGARPVTLVIAMSVPPELDQAWVLECAKGIRDECATIGIVLAGGDMTRSKEIMLTATVVGDFGGRAPVTRAGARPGDVVAVIGRLGMAAAGLAVLGRGFRSPRAVVLAFRVPEPPYGQGIVAAESGATSMIDVSDGLLADLGHIAKASGVGIDLDSSKLEVSEPQKTVAAAIGGGDPLSYILAGGDDHALAATFPSARVPEGWTVIGTVTDQGAGTVLVDSAPWTGPTGYQHFSR